MNWRAYYTCEHGVRMSNSCEQCLNETREWLGRERRRWAELAVDAAWELNR